MDEFARRDMVTVRGAAFCKDCLVEDMLTKIRAGLSPTSPDDDELISPTVVATLVGARCVLCDAGAEGEADKQVVLQLELEPQPKHQPQRRNQPQLKY